MSCKKYDVIVCGAGVAGIAASIAAARQGAKVALIEKQCLLGGLATSGLIYIYLPLCDGAGHQMIYGIPEEMMRRGAQYGPFDVAPEWGGPTNGNPGLNNQRFICCFSPAGMILTMDKMLEEAGVDLWLDSLVTGANVENGIINSIAVSNTSGTLEISADNFVDATGGAYLTKLAGGMTFPGVNRVSPWVVEFSPHEQPFHIKGPVYIRGLWKNETGISLDEEGGAPVFPACDKGKEITQFMRKSWSLIRLQYDSLPSDADRKECFPLTLAAMPQLRKIARIDAVCNLDEDSISKSYDDSIGKVGDWRKSNSVWDTPYGALVPKGLKNLLAAGRCIGADGEAWEVYRVIPTAAMTGEAAGLAAALACQSNVYTTDLDVRKLQKILPCFSK